MEKLRFAWAPRLQHARSMGAPNPVLLHQRGLRLWKSSPARAEVEFRQCLAIAPDFAEAHYHLGELLAEQGRHHEAISCLRDAVRLDRNSAEGLELLAKELERIGKEQLAANAYADLGALLLRQRRDRSAFAAFVRAEKLSPSYRTRFARGTMRSSEPDPEPEE